MVEILSTNLIVIKQGGLCLSRLGEVGQHEVDTDLRKMDYENDRVDFFALLLCILSLLCLKLHSLANFYSISQ